ncbi:unnamed protein product, partial [marine sediment metagenome]
HSVSKATAAVAVEAARQAEAKSVSREFAKIKSQVAELQKKAKSIEEIDSKIRVGNVLAEMSFLIDEKIVLGKVEFKAEKFADKQLSKANVGSAVRVARARFGGKNAPLLGDVRFKVVINGVAADASDVAKLICKLEDSPYFCQVIPSFSRNKKIKVGMSLAKEDLQVTEFEISCYLANYRQERVYFTKEVQNRDAER